MSIIKVNVFSEFELTEAETLAGQHFTITQVQVIQNLRAKIAAEKLALKLDATNIVDFAQKEASLSGQLDILGYILDCHNTATESILQTNQEEPQPDTITYSSSNIFK
jgi:hypothetical protein